MIFKLKLTRCVFIVKLIYFYGKSFFISINYYLYDATAILSNLAEISRVCKKLTQVQRNLPDK